MIKHSYFLGYPFRKTYRLMFLVGMLLMACQSKDHSTKDHSPFASDILGNLKYKAIFYGGYRANTRNTQPTIDPQHYENHFGMFTIEGKAKFSLWNFLDKGALEGLIRGDTLIQKTFQSNKEQLLPTLLTPSKK